jgi:hypothetical protein
MTKQKSRVIFFFAEMGNILVKNTCVNACKNLLAFNIATLVCVVTSPFAQSITVAS